MHFTPDRQISDQLTLLEGEQRLDWLDDEHTDHHDGEYRDGATSHVQEEQIHRHLFQGSQRQVPGFLYYQVVGVGLPHVFHIVKEGAGWCIPRRRRYLRALVLFRSAGRMLGLLTLACETRQKAGKPPFFPAFRRDTRPSVDREGTEVSRQVAWL